MGGEMILAEAVGEKPAELRRTHEIETVRGTA
jgi:hypothetical protein